MMNTVVVMVLAIVVLLFLVGFFMMGSGDFMSKIQGYFSYSNVDSVVQGCNVLANSGGDYVFCCEKKEVKYYLDSEKMNDEMSCSEVVDEGIVDGRILFVDCG